jgi:hypothetical protein
MITRSMHAPKRVDTRWEQTIQIHRRGRRDDHPPYRRRERQSNGTHVTDWIILAMFVATCVYLWWPR